MIFILVTAIISLDQLAKFVISKNLVLGQSIPVIPGVFSLSLVHNRGAAFGLFKGQVLLFIVFSVLAVILICSNLRRAGWRKLSFFNLALALVLAGAVGNLIDRWRLGYVVDFLDFRVWPVFNVADSSITVGAVLLAWAVLKHKDK
ncbi:MAG: signal peptidase II [Candidatus Omnitrophota bacterium]|nr:signal peptidase II [Candidatus Omnitrophota bacterium]